MMPTQPDSPSKALTSAEESEFDPSERRHPSRRSCRADRHVSRPMLFRLRPVWQDRGTSVVLTCFSINTLIQRGRIHDDLVIVNDE
jgi:hypothetical protein